MRHEDFLVTRIRAGKRLLRCAFQAVIELFGHPSLQFLDERLDLESRHEHAEQPADPAELGKVADQRLSSAGVLDLHGDRPTVPPFGAVHLADGCGSSWPVIEVRETMS